MQGFGLANPVMSLAAMFHTTFYEALGFRLANYKLQDKFQWSFNIYQFDSIYQSDRAQPEWHVYNFLDFVGIYISMK